VYTPPVLLGLLFYAYRTGVFSLRKIEKTTYETIPSKGDVGLPETMDMDIELAIRKVHLEKLAQAKRVLDISVKERYEADQAEYEAKRQKWQ
jgi:hypothetical protein